MRCVVVATCRWFGLGLGLGCMACLGLVGVGVEVADFRARAGKKAARGHRAFST